MAKDKGGKSGKGAEPPKRGRSERPGHSKGKVSGGSTEKTTETQGKATKHTHNYNVDYIKPNGQPGKKCLCGETQ